jgi:outer membrane protein OmpA-like peptidoglycan-associated protein
MADRIRIEKPWGGGPLSTNFVEISGKVRVWNGRGQRVGLYSNPAEQRQLSEMPFVFEGDPAKPRERMCHVRWADLTDGKGVIQIQAWVKYTSSLPPGFPEMFRFTQGSFGYQADWEFSYTQDQENVTAMAHDPVEVSRNEEGNSEGPSLECYRQEHGNLIKAMAYFHMWLRLLPPPDASSKPITIGVGPIGAEVGGTTARQRGGAPFIVKLFVFGRPERRPGPPSIPNSLLNPDLIYFPVNRDDPNPTEWTKIHRWHTDLENFASPHLLRAIVAGTVPVHIRGGASTPGGDVINIPLSERRANNVALQLRRYFGNRVTTSAEGVGSAQAQALGRNFSGDIFAKIWIERADAERVVRGHD